MTVLAEEQKTQQPLTAEQAPRHATPTEAETPVPQSDRSTSATGLWVIPVLWRRLAMFVAGMTVILVLVEVSLSPPERTRRMLSREVYRNPTPYVEFYQKPNFEGLAEHVFTTFNRMHERLEATRAIVPPGRFLDIRYEDLVTHTVDEMRRIYDFLHLGEFETVRPAIEAYADANSDYLPHGYQPASDLEREVYCRWKPYYEKYGYGPGLDGQTGSHQQPEQHQQSRGR